MSKYLTAFRDANKDNFKLIGDCLLIEVLKEDEFKTKSGLIIADSTGRQVNGLSADKPTFVRVLIVGEGYYNEDDGSDVRLDSQPGDIVLVGTTSIKRFSVFGPIVNYGDTSLGLIRESDVQMRFNGQAGFDAFFREANEALNGQKAQAE
jgi:co-chaperonin GroES (HSP10)